MKPLELIQTIPKGKVTTYKILAEVCKKHPRAIASTMKHNKDPLNIPCYKVISHSGKIGGYSAADGVKSKMELLEKDGVIIKNGVIDPSFFHHFL